MTLEEALALDEEMLFGILTVRIDSQFATKNPNPSWEFDAASNFKWGQFVNRWYDRKWPTALPLEFLQTFVRELSNKELCEQALALGYVEQAMRAAAALRSLELKEGVTLYI